MNHYINLCPKFCEESEMLTLDIPKEYMDQVLALAAYLADEKNITERRAFSDIIRGTLDQLLEKNYDSKNRKASKRGRRNS